jgi:hypothetical protein
MKKYYEPPLDMFGAAAVERWFTKDDIEEIIVLTHRMELWQN